MLPARCRIYVSGMISTTTVLAARAERLTKTYGSGLAAVTALAGVSIEIPAGTFTSVMGPSGSGKSTLMHCMAGLDSVTNGRAWIGAQEISGMPERHLTRLRRGQLAQMVAAESVIIAVIGAVLGSALGLALGAALADAVTRSQQATVSIPVMQIAVYIAAAAVAGVLAAVAPARRAARLNVLEAIAAG
jgi:predicted ABC-type transport system involved in lysophospholipase L1 biosynthesis ATPase subunit